MNPVSAASSSPAWQPSFDSRPTLAEVARRGHPAELRAFAEANPGQVDALRTELARTNAGALFALEPSTQVTPVTVTARPEAAEAPREEKGWLARQLDHAREFIGDHDGSEVIASAGDWAQSKIDGIRTDTPGLSQAASVTRGVLGFGKDAVQGVASLPGLAVNGAVGGLQTGVAVAEGRTTVGEVASGSWEAIKAVPGAVAKPVTEAWGRGDYVEAVTRGVTEIATLPLAPAKAGTVGRAADVAADVGRAADRAGDAGRVADTAGGAARTARPRIELDAGGPGAWNKTLNGALKPDTDYAVGPYTYSTDGNGRVSQVTGRLELETHERNGYQQRKAGEVAGIKDGVAGDEGGHLIAAIFNGPGEQINYHAMNGTLNKSDWKVMENEWAAALKDGKAVDVDVRAHFDGASKRPEAFQVTFRIDGAESTRFFDNE